MGKRLDSLILNAVTCALFFAVFYASFRSAAAAALLAGICLVMARKLFRGLQIRLSRGRAVRCKSDRRRARILLERWACLSDEAARREILAALRVLFPGAALQAEELDVVCRSAACPPLDAGTCFDLWRAGQGRARLLIVTPGRADAAALELARTLKDPETRVLDGPFLLPLLARHPELLPEDDAVDPPVKKRLWLPKVPRARLFRCAFTGLGMLLLYALLGRPFYLPAGLGLLLLAGLGLRKGPRRERLFGAPE